MAQTTPYGDLTEENESEYSQAGWTATRKFLCDGADMSNPSSTIVELLNSSFIPHRGDNHPSGEDMQADVITGKAITSNQIYVTVKYKKLSAVEMEPDDSMPGLMTIGSSVQEQETPFDANGNPMNVAYQAKGGAVPIYQISSTISGSVISNPQNAVVAKVQIPNTIIRFSRREQTEPSDKIKTYEGKINASPCQWGDLDAATGTLLCTRIEGNTNDGGISYVVEYEFQYYQGNIGNGTDTGWAFFTAYSLPNGTTGQAQDGSNATIGPGDSPSDADLQEFDVYPSAEFNNLGLV